jgi:flavin reductase (DIM6/NTAB) family NADH-FMN oxidoreductase RutF
MQKAISLIPSEITTGQLHSYLLGAVGPRPIAFASTIDDQGNPNLSPFSFFNVFSANPPVLIFSPARRVRDNSTKHTLNNVLRIKEVVINVVNYELVQQMSLTSTEYGENENEFIKAGLTMLSSDMVKPFRVAESPVQFECKVIKVEALGKDGGAGNLVFAEIVKMHIHKSVLDKNGSIDQFKIDLVARMGGNWYTRANKGMFEVPKPLSKLGIGVDRIPKEIKALKMLKGNDLGLLGNVERIPDKNEIEEFMVSNEDVASLVQKKDLKGLLKITRKYLDNNEILSAWKVLLIHIELNGSTRKN